MRTQRIYLETTLFNYYFDTDRDAHADTVTLFKEIAARKYEAYTSDAVLGELAKAPAEKRDAMLALVGEYNISVLQVTEEARRLADVYISAGIIPQKYRTDGIHIAVATIHEADIIVSMNFQHIVKLKTMQMTRVINTLNGYHPIEIRTPMEVIDYENN